MDRLAMEREAALQLELAERAALQSFAAFVRLMWPVVEPTPLAWGRHMQVVCDALQDVHEGRCRRLIINIPPGFSKSLLTSTFFPAWRWLKNPAIRSLYLSHDINVARFDSRRCRILLTSEPYARLKARAGVSFDFADDQDQVTNYANNKNGFRFCASIDARITGRRADDVVVDDPHDAKEAIQGDPERIAERMAGTASTFDQVLRSRVNEPLTCSMVVIMQRLHENDLTGHLEKTGKWRIIRLPMRFDPEIACPEDWRTVPGELLDERRFPEAEVAEREKALGAQASGQYGQRPVSPTGGLFPPSIWRYQDERSFPRAYDREAAGWDTAFGGNGTGANHAGIFGGKHRGRLYIYAAEVIRCEIDVLMERMKDLKQEHPKNTAWYMEDRANARSVTTMLRESIPWIVLEQPDGDKVARAQSWQPTVAAGNVVLPCTCGRGDIHEHPDLTSLPARSWIRAFVAEHASFPKGALKDQVDAMGYLVPKLLVEEELDWACLAPAIR